MSKGLLILLASLSLSSCAEIGLFPSKDPLAGIDKDVYYSEYPCIEVIHEQTMHHPRHRNMTHIKTKESVIFVGFILAERTEKYGPTPYFRCEVRNRKIHSLEYSDKPFSQ